MCPEYFRADFELSGNPPFEVSLRFTHRCLNFVSKFGVCVTSLFRTSFLLWGYLSPVQNTFSANNFMQSLIIKYAIFHDGIIFSCLGMISFLRWWIFNLKEFHRLSSYHFDCVLKLFCQIFCCQIMVVFHWQNQLYCRLVFGLMQCNPRSLLSDGALYSMRRLNLKPINDGFLKQRLRVGFDRCWWK